jgi:thiamine-monophosphate kinase
MHELAAEAAGRLDIPLWRFAFGVGDWTIACVVRESDRAAFRDALGDGLELFEVGRFDGAGLVRIEDAHGSKHEVPKVINEHFRRRLEDDGLYLPELLERR